MCVVGEDIRVNIPINKLSAAAYGRIIAAVVIRVNAIVMLIFTVKVCDANAQQHRRGQRIGHVG